MRAAMHSPSLCAATITDTIGSIEHVECDRGRIAARAVARSGYPRYAYPSSANASQNIQAPIVTGLTPPAGETGNGAKPRAAVTGVSTWAPGSRPSDAAPAYRLRRVRGEWPAREGSNP